MKVIVSKNEFIEYAQSLGLNVISIDENTVEMEIEPMPLKAPAPRPIDPKFQQLAGCDIQKAETKNVAGYNLWLLSSGDRKINVIKVIRNMTGFGLAASKEMADNPPRLILSGILEDVGERYLRELREAGATAELIWSFSN